MDHQNYYTCNDVTKNKQNQLNLEEDYLRTWHSISLAAQDTNPTLSVLLSSLDQYVNPYNLNIFGYVSIYNEDRIILKK